MALDRGSRFLGLRVDLKADLGAYLSQFAPFVPANGARMSPGCYDIPAVHARIRGFYSHTLPVDAYRGAGRPEAAYAIERFVDFIADTIGKTPDALARSTSSRRRECPTGRRRTAPTTPASSRATCAAPWKLADWSGFSAREAASRRAGKARGIGLASYIEACSGGGAEGAEVRIDADGAATVLSGTPVERAGGHQTSYASSFPSISTSTPNRVPRVPRVTRT
jgi:carbon-monoxide dehydrogenase large subunit